MENIQRITLDILNNRTYEQAYSKQYDKGRILKIKLVEDGAPLDLTNSIITFKAKKPDGTVVYNHCDVDKKNSEIIVELTEQLTVIPGKIPFEIEIGSKVKKLINVKLDKLSQGISTSVLNQIKQIITSSGKISNPYKFTSNIKMTNVQANYEDYKDSILYPYLILQCNTVKKKFTENEYVSSDIDFKDVLIVHDYCTLTDFSFDIEYVGANIVKTVTGTLKIEKAVVDGDEIESTNEFTALQVALSNLATANAEAKEYYEDMQEITGIQASETEPINDKISVWVRTSNLTTATINIPEIKDEETNLTDTWSSQKIYEILNSGGSTIDSEELNTALAEILV